MLIGRFELEIDNNTYYPLCNCITANSHKYLFLRVVLDMFTVSVIIIQCVDEVVYIVCKICLRSFANTFYF